MIGGALSRAGRAEATAAGWLPAGCAAWAPDPLLPCPYPPPSGAAGHEPLTQLPSSRVTSSTAPRRAVPMTGLPLLGALWTLADSVFTVSTRLCAQSHDGIRHTATATAAT